MDSKAGVRELHVADVGPIHYGHLINCAGLQADRVAYPFGVGHQYTLLPFKGLYWQLKKSCPIQPRVNLYPVPDLNVPFLGFISPHCRSRSCCDHWAYCHASFGAENYRLQAIEPAMAAANLSLLASSTLLTAVIFVAMHEQAFLALPPLLLQAAQQLIPEIRAEHLELSQKVELFPVV